jgi:hypothetical protein
MRQDELWRAGHRARTVHETLSRVLVRCVTTVPVHAGEDIVQACSAATSATWSPASERMVEEAVKTYRVSYERDESGWWVASVRGVRGC